MSKALKTCHQLYLDQGRLEEASITEAVPTRSVVNWAGFGQSVDGRVLCHTCGFEGEFWLNRYWACECLAASQIPEIVPIAHLLTDAIQSHDIALYLYALLPGNWMPKGPKGDRWGDTLVADVGKLSQVCRAVENNRR